MCRNFDAQPFDLPLAEPVLYWKILLAGPAHTYTERVCVLLERLHHCTGRHPSDLGLAGDVQLHSPALARVYFFPLENEEHLGIQFAAGANQHLVSIRISYDTQEYMGIEKGSRICANGEVKNEMQPCQ